MDLNSGLDQNMKQYGPFFVWVKSGLRSKKEEEEEKHDFAGSFMIFLFMFHDFA